MPPAPITPIRGQLTPIRCAVPAQVIRGPGGYATPTADGALCGATMQSGERSLEPDTEIAAKQAANGLSLVGGEGQAKRSRAESGFSLSAGQVLELEEKFGRDKHAFRSYLEWLGVDCLWVPPFFTSPLRDGVYDVADYNNILPECGTVEDFHEFLDACHQRLGLCLGRWSLAQPLLQAGELRPLLPWRGTDFAYYLLSRPGEEDNPRIRALRLWLREQAALFAREPRPSP